MPPVDELLHFDLGDEVFESRRCFETDVLGCLDLDRFASSRVAAGAGSALRHSESAQVGEGETAFLLEVGTHKAEHLLDDFFCFYLSQLVVASDLVDDFALVQSNLQT